MPLMTYVDSSGVGGLINRSPKRGILPDVFVGGCDQKPPTRWESEIGQYFWTQLRQMAHVDWLKELRIIRQLLARPYVPPGSVALWGMSETVQRHQSFTNVSGYTDLHVGR
jgi:hypothetical protein